MVGQIQVLDLESKWLAQYPLPACQGYWSLNFDFGPVTVVGGTPQTWILGPRRFWIHQS